MAANSPSDKIEDPIHPDCGGKPAPLSANIVDAKSSNRVIQKDQKCYLLDIIIVRLDILNMTAAQIAKLLVTINFNGKNFNMPSSRINVTDFKFDSILQVIAKPSELKQELSDAPLTVKVSQVKTVLGYGSLKWPAEFLADIENGDGAVNGSFEIELMKCNGTRIGTTLIAVRLQPKCEEYKEDNTVDGECRNAHKEIEPNDVLFIVDKESGKRCICSQIGFIPASGSDHDLQPKCLDLSSYRPVHGQFVNNMDILDSPDLACQKATRDHYQKILKVLKSKNETTFSDQNTDLFCTLPSNNLHQGAEDFPGFVPESRAFAAKDAKQIAHAECAPNLVENEPQSLRRCPLCKENTEYLPILAACPNCCYKPIPNFDEKPYNDSQKADLILKEYYENIKNNENSVADKSRCSCECGSKAPCASCRIRKLCEDIFQSSLHVTKSDDIGEPISSAANCTTNDNRPFLTKIFSELKDIYDTEEPRIKEFKSDNHCEKQLNKTPNYLKHIRRAKRIVQPVQNDETSQIVKPKMMRKRKKTSAKAASKTAVKSKLYDYQYAQQACTFKCGHKACVKKMPEHQNVPPNMGWLWNVDNPQKWKPGTIRKPIKELMRYFLKDFPADTLLVSPYSYRRKSKQLNDPCHKTILQKSALHICKKNGAYIITMRPLKPTEVLNDAADPFENMKPIQFKIVKNPHLEKIRNLKSSLKAMGYKKCVCHRPIPFCYCRNFVEKKRLEYQCRKECVKLKIESCCDTLVLTDTSESEDEFDFALTPPVGVVKPEKLKIFDLVNVATQYNELDWNPVQVFPRPPNKYMRMYQCAVKERKADDTFYGNDVTDMTKRDARNTLSRDRRKEIIGKGFAGAKGQGDGLLKFGKVGGDIVPPLKFNMLKYGTSKSGKGGADTEPPQKFNMLKYALKSVNKKKSKPEEVALRRKEKLKLLRGSPPPILCMIDRLGKPPNPCAPCFPCGDDRVC